MNQRTFTVLVVLTGVLSSIVLFWPRPDHELDRLYTLSLRLQTLQRNLPSSLQTAQMLSQELSQGLAEQGLSSTDQLEQSLSPRGAAGPARAASTPWRMLLGKALELPAGYEKEFEKLASLDPNSVEAYLMAEQLSQRLWRESALGGADWPWKVLLLLVIWGLVGLALSGRRFKKGPVERIKRATLMLGAGELGLRVDLPPGSELADLAGAFNKMSQELQRSREELTKAKDYNERVVRSIGNMLMVVSADGLVQSVNAATPETLGYDEAELVGAPFQEFLAENSRQVFRLDQSLRHVEGAYLSKEGNEIPVLFSSSVVAGKDAYSNNVVTVAQDISERKQVELELSQTQKQLEKYAASLEEQEIRLRQLLDRLIDSQEKERRLVANDLHDGVLQYVIAANMHMKAFRKGLEVLTERDDYDQDVEELISSQDFERGMERLKEAVTEGRRLIFNLRPSMLDDFGLLPTLQKCVADLEHDKGCQVEFFAALDQVELPPAVETTAYRIIQEALNNIAKHCPDGASVELSIEVNGENVELLVKDSGPGFELEAHNEGIGLSSMRERAELLGGTFELSSSVEEGTRVHSTLPFTPMASSLKRLMLKD